MESSLSVYRVGRGEPLLVGALDRASGGFAYAPSYLCEPLARPISRSLPLGARVFSKAEAMPYFEGLVPEGNARRLMAAELHVREDDYLAMLERCGRECMGDVLIADKLEDVPGGWVPIASSELARALARPAAMVDLNRASRLSLAGTQSKVGLAHRPGTLLDQGWLRPVGRAASTHILKTSARDDISYFEYLCMGAAAECGVRAAATELLGFGTPVLCSERFDRIALEADGEFAVSRLHQEDFTQALGLTSGSKYAELEGGSYAAIARLLAGEAEDPASDLVALVRLACFNYLVGNCDNHLKNLALVYREDWMAFSLAPAYDVVCTTWFPDLSREMGMAIGGVRDIDAVGPMDVLGLATDMRVGKRLVRRVAHELAERIDDAVYEVAERSQGDFEELGWKAEELVRDMEPRRRVLAAV